MFIQLCPTFLLQIPTKTRWNKSLLLQQRCIFIYFYTMGLLEIIEEIEQQLYLEETLESFWTLVLIFLEEPSMLGHARTMTHCLEIQKSFPTNEGWQFALESWDSSCVFLIGCYQQPQHLKRNIVCTWICALCFEPLRFGKKNEMTSALREQLTDYLKSYGFATGLCWVICRLKTTRGVQAWSFHGRDGLMFIMKRS